MRRALVVPILLLTLLGCNDGGDDAATGASATIEKIRAAIDDEAGTESFVTDPIGGDGRIVCIDGEPVRLYVFGSEGERVAATARIDPSDPSNVGSAIISWIGTPRLWADGPAVVMYSGPDEALVEELIHGLGPPFAAGRGRAAEPELGC